MQQHAATFFAQVDAATGASLPQFAKDEFEAFLECGILAHGFLRLRCGDCGRCVARGGAGEPFVRSLRPLQPFQIGADAMTEKIQIASAKAAKDLAATYAKVKTDARKKLLTAISLFGSTVFPVT